MQIFCIDLANMCIYLVCRLDYAWAQQLTQFTQQLVKKLAQLAQQLVQL